MESLSASGARIRGDDYQHLFAWCQVLRALSNPDFFEVGVEDPDTGSVDDVTLYASSAPNEFFQVKYSVDARELVDLEWLMQKTSERGSSILQKFHRAWVQEQERPSLALVTNRPIDPSDPVIALIDGHNGTLVRGLSKGGPKSLVGKARIELADHLSVNEQDLLAFLEDVRIRLGKPEIELRNDAAMLMHRAGLRDDPDSIQRGVDLVRSWVTAGKRRLTIEDIRQEVDALALLAGPPAAVLRVDAIDHSHDPLDAAIALDWVGLFEGDEPRTRRVARDPSHWNALMRPELQSARDRLRRLGERRVLIVGAMRLPSWFVVGAELSKTSGFEVVSQQGPQFWASDLAPEPFPLGVLQDAVLNEHSELALGISVSADLTDDLENFVHGQAKEWGRMVVLAPTEGPSNQALSSPEAALGCAFAIRDRVRQLVRECESTRIHLFLAMPHGLSLLLGHLWDRMPTTQLYEDLGATGDGYMPSFLLPG